MRELLALLPKPGRYLGIEEGAVRARPADARLHVALAFPDVYEVAMSYLGQKIIYGQLNAMDGVLAERVFAPCREAAALLRSRGVKLATLESDTDLDRAHVLGFSLTHELAFTNVLYMLDLGGIPLRSEDRGDDLKAWPLVVAGGGCTVCAEPLAPFMDVMALGEAEAVFPPLLDLLMEARREGWSRTAFLREARHIPGAYVPSLFRLEADGRLTPRFEDYKTARRRPVADLSAPEGGAFYPVRQVLPLGAVHNRLSLEIARGCTRGCRFCQAGMTLRPSRERSLEDVTSLLDACLKATGYDDVSFLSLSTGDFSGLKTLFMDVADRCAGEQISLSLPSLRVGSVDGDIMAKVAGIRRTGATLAPEAGSQRLRDVINKGVTEEALFKHVRHLVSHGWQQVKLYFMIGLPTERDEDLDAIAELGVKVRDLCRHRGEDGVWQGTRLNVTLAVSPFVPKTHTPFQWEAQIGLEEMKRRIFYLRDRVKGQKNLTLRWHEPAMSHLEGILSRGDRRLADVVEKAWRKGGVFCSWAEGFDLAPWLEALEECGMSPEFWTGARPLDAPLPWDHLEVGLRRDFLLTERDRALRGRVTGDCRYGVCRHCGACDTRAGASLLRVSERDAELRTRLNFPVRDQRDDDPVMTPVAASAFGHGGAGDSIPCQGSLRGQLPSQNIMTKSAPPAPDPVLTRRAVRFRVWHRKADLAAWISQLELQTLLERALRRGGVPLAFSQGFHPLPLLSFARALSVGVESEAEWFAVTLRAPMPPGEVTARLANTMLPGLEPLRADLLPLTGSIPAAAEESFFLRYTADGEDRLRADWETFAASSVWPVRRVNKRGESKEQDARALLKSLDAGRDGLRFTLDWREAYLSPLLLAGSISPWLDRAEIRLRKLSQSF